MNKLPGTLSSFLEKSRLHGYGVMPLSGDASERKYYRLKRNSHTLILMDSSKVNTMDDYLRVDNYLANNNLSVPEVYYSDTEHKYLVLEDFGEYTINQLLDLDTHLQGEIYEKIIDLIVALTGLKESPLPAFDSKFFVSELNFFTDFYLKHIGRTNPGNNTKDFFNSWIKPMNYIYENDPHNIFVHKDFHSANLFWLPRRSGVRKVGLIDFQAAKNGSVTYDITSILYDCRMPLSSKFRNRLLIKFLDQIKLDKATFRNLCDIYIAQRNIKILGNFAYINKYRHDSSYLKFLPSAISYVRRAVNNPLLRDLKSWLYSNKIL